MNKLPYNYNDVNIYNSFRNPSQIHTSDTGLNRYFEKYLIQKIISVYEFENIPETWSKSYFLYVLFCFGYIAIIPTKKYGVIPQQCTLAGYDVYYQPTHALIANPVFKTGIDLRIHRDCELIKMQPDYGSPYDIVTYYADLLSLATESISSNFINSKLAYVFAADNKTVAESFKKLYDKIASGEPAAFADKNLFNEDGRENWLLFNQNLKNNYIAGDILEDMAMIDSRFNTDVGIPNVNIAKKSGVTEAEVYSNNTDTQTKCALWLESMQDTIAKVNDMFGLNITVKYRFEGDNYVSAE